MITVCIPTYKRPKLLKKALSSIQNQTIKDLQILVSDNASDDETSDLVTQLAKEDPRIRYICHPTNIGMLQNYEFLFSQIDTDFFAFLSDDDLWFPNFCEIALQGFSQFPDIAFFSCSTICYSKNKGILKVSMDSWPREGRFSPPEGLFELIGKYPFPANVLFHKKSLSKAKIDFQNPYAWDSDYLLQLGAQFPFAVSKHPCGIFLHHSGSLTSTQNTQVVIASMKRLQERILSFSWIDPSARAFAASLVHSDISQAHRSSIVANLMQKNFKAAKKYAFAVLKDQKKKPTFVLLFFIASICSLVPFMHIFLVLLKNAYNLYRRTLKWFRLSKYRKFAD